MTINKYQGKTKEEAVEKAKQELGAGAVVLNVKEIKPKGMFKMFKNTLYEVTAAVEEKEAFPAQTLRSETKPVHDTISLAADEKITIPGVARENTRPAVAPAPAEQEVVPMKEAKRESTNEGLEKRLENLSNILEKQFSVEEMRKSHPVEPQEKENRTEGFQFIKMLYRTLLENDVNEKYVNQIMDEAEKVLHNGSSVDSILSNVYQKLILKFDQPQTIELTGKKPKVIFFIGPTGAGIANHVLEFVLASPEVLVVTTPEPTSLTDSYSLLKSLYRNPKFNREYTKISVLSNRVISAAEGRGVYDKLNTVVGQFLEGEITYAGMIPQDSALEKAIRMQKPVSLQAPLSKSARAFEVVAAELLQGESSDAYRSFGLSRLFSGFWKQKNEGVE